MRMTELSGCTRVSGHPIILLITISFEAFLNTDLESYIGMEGA